MKPLNVGNWLKDNLERMAETMNIDDLNNFLDRLNTIIKNKERGKK